MKPLALRKGFTGLTTFKASTNSGELTLEIYDVIGADFFGEGITGKSVSDALNQNSGFSSITVRINSPGGDLFEGVAIYNLLRSQGKPVNVMVDGVAASAASIVAMAGDSITMGDGAMIMIHNAMALAFGNGNDLRTLADVLDTVSASAADVYVKRTGMNKADVQALMDAETWLGAQEAMDKGFATALANTKSAPKAKALAQAFDLSVFNNTPEALKATTEPEPTPVAEPKHVEDPQITAIRERVAVLRKLRS